ncbi:MAG TPA: HAD family hydrolase [Silvibacterium sp.]|nr:HAD family hydrolase [Silvibacterium sp.]
MNSTSSHPTTSSAAAPESRVFIQKGFRWDEQGAYLFDIDGTLLRSRDRIHFDSFYSSVRAVMGQDLVLDGVTVSGNTDPGILRDAFRLARLDEAHWQPHLENILETMRRDVAARRSEMKLVKMPGVDETLTYLQSKGAALGVATGNLESIGWLKIEVLGLRHWFKFGGFSDTYDVRSDMIAHVLCEAQSHAGAGATVCVVGDTPFDISAARANGLPTIAVATGNFTFEQLMEHDPEVCTTSFEALLQTVDCRSIA